MTTAKRAKHVAVASVVTAVLLAAHLIHPAFVFPPAWIGQWIVRVTPGGIATRMIELFGHWAMRLLNGATTAAFVATLASLLGLLPRRRAPAGVATPEGSAPDPIRRSMLRAGAYAFAALVVGGGAVLRTLPSTVTRFGGRLLSFGPVVGARLRSESPSEAARWQIPGLTPEITPTPSFYVVNEEIEDPILATAGWRLRIDGLVDHPAELSYQDLISMPAVEQYVTLECISNYVGGNLMSTALWRGVRMADVLDLAGVRPSAGGVVTRGGSGYWTSLPMDKARAPDTIIAYGMNGHALPQAHGFPARVLTTGLYGMKNCKWLERLELVRRPGDGFWEERGWSPDQPVRTTARFDTPRGGDVAAGGMLAGIAFAGARGISRVEVSLDDGKTWSPARLRAPLARTTWVQWQFTLPEAVRGFVQPMVRAVDATGVTQDGAFRQPHPSGAGGYHQIAIRVVPA